MGQAAASSGREDSAWQDSAFPVERGQHTARWIGWRLRTLVGAGLLGCVAVFALAWTMSEHLQIDARWRADPSGRVRLTESAEPALHSAVGAALRWVANPATGERVGLDDAALLQRSPRWTVEAGALERQSALNASLSRLLEPPSASHEDAPKAAPAAASRVTGGHRLTLAFEDGSTATAVLLRPRGFANLGATFWFVASLALVLYLVTGAVLLANPSARNALYAVMAGCQTANLLCVAVESVPSLALPMHFASHELAWRTAFDLATAAAVVHSTVLHPHRLPRGDTIAAIAWAAAALLWLLQAALVDTLPWWPTQLGVLALGGSAVALLAWSHRLQPHPFSLVLRRFGHLTVGSWALLTVAIAVAPPVAQQHLAVTGAVIWYVFLATLLLLVPFLARSQQMLREFAFLALTSAIATALDLVFAALFSWGEFASLTLSLFLALGLYAGIRQWALNRLLGTRVPTTERMFEQVYRIARELESHPERTSALLLQLMKELFEPIEATVIRRSTGASHAVADGSALLLAMPFNRFDLNTVAGGEGDDSAAANRSLLLRFAHRGRRLFTNDDARLADRIIEQLRRAVAFDKAVEQGRNEERQRIAQDLHDDIGARLLTLMYKSSTPEMEEYARHTLQDLKTLTRGLAASNHRLTHAAGEWKADLTQRLSAAQMTLAWRFRHDDDPLLSAVQWSGVTRVLRELASNAIAHAKASQLDIDIDLHHDTLRLTVQDDGTGEDPQAWAHGLGLGGIRKRVKQLGGDVQWTRAVPRGIRCQVTVDAFSSKG